MKGIFSTALIAFFSVVLLAGCNTIEGAGEDIESGGEDISHAAGSD